MHSINLFYNNQLLYRLIYSLRLVRLEILKAYIQANLISNFIKFSKLYYYFNTICLEQK